MKPSSYKKQETGDNPISTISSTNCSLLIALMLPRFRRILQNSLSRTGNVQKGTQSGASQMFVQRPDHYGSTRGSLGRVWRASRGLEVGEAAHASWLLLADHGGRFAILRSTCQACQLHGNKIHAPAVELHSLATPWPFHTWAFDLVGPINPPSRGKIWVLIATECYTKWVGTIPLKRATGPAVSNFILDNIFCRFEIPR